MQLVVHVLHAAMMIQVSIPNANVHFYFHGKNYWLVLIGSPFVFLCFSFLSGAAASGPVRLFTPYKRRRRNQPNVEQTPNNVQAKQKKTTEEEIEHDHSGVGSGVGVGISVGVSVGGGGSGSGGGGGGGVVTKEETTWESITDGIDGTNEYIDTSSQSELF